MGLVPADKLDAEVDRLATLLAANAPVAMAGMKRTINEIARGKLDEAAADARARDSMHGAEIKEGVRARAEILAVDEGHGIRHAGARGAVAVDLVAVVRIAERDAADHAAVIGQIEMLADQRRMPR